MDLFSSFLVCSSIIACIMAFVQLSTCSFLPPPFPSFLPSLPFLPVHPLPSLPGPFVPSFVLSLLISQIFVCLKAYLAHLVGWSAGWLLVAWLLGIWIGSLIIAVHNPSRKRRGLARKRPPGAKTKEKTRHLAILLKHSLMSTWAKAKWLCNTSLACWKDDHWKWYSKCKWIHQNW